MGKAKFRIIPIESGEWLIKCGISRDSIGAVVKRGFRQFEAKRLGSVISTETSLEAAAAKVWEADQAALGTPAGRVLS